MSVSDHNSKKFQALYRKHYGEDLSDERSAELLEALVALFLAAGKIAAREDAENGQKRTDMSIAPNEGLAPTSNPDLPYQPNRTEQEAGTKDDPCTNAQERTS